MDVVYATANAVVTLPSGAPIVVRGGTHWWAEDPVVKLQPSLFSVDPRYGMAYSSPPPQLFDAPNAVEAATATPGEQRSVKRRAI